MSSSDPLTSFPTTPRPSSRISPSFGNLGFFQCCGLPARTPHLASSMLRASPHPSFGNLGFFRCCGLPPRTSFQALIRESWRLPVLRATSPHPSFGNLGICQWCGLPARTSFQARLGFFQCCGLPARTPHSGILASSSAAGCQPAPLIRESWLLPVLRAASPPAHTPHSGILASASAAGCTPAPLIWHLPCCGPALTPHLGILASSGAAGCHPAPPSKPSFGNLGVFQCCGLPARTSFQARLGFFQCCGLPARTFQALIRESSRLPVLRAASPHLLRSPSGILASSGAAGQPAPSSSAAIFKALFGNLCQPHLPSPHSGILASSSAAGCHRTFFQALIRESWLLPVLRTSFQGLIREVWRLPVLRAASQPAPPSKPSLGNLGFFQCCGLPARATFQALIRESWLLPVLRAASPRLSSLIPVLRVDGRPDAP